MNTQRDDAGRGRIIPIGGHRARNEREADKRLRAEMYAIPNSPKRLLNKRQAAAFLGVSEGTLNTLMRTGAIRWTVNGGKASFQLGHLEAYVDSLQTKPDGLAVYERL